MYVTPRRNDALFVPVVLLAILLATAGAYQRGAKPLFDGKSFKGWEGDMSVFRIEDGAITGGSLKESLAHNEFLCTTEEYDDFELRVKFKLLGDPERQRRSPIPLQTDSEPPRSDRLPGRPGATILGRALRRVAAAEDTGRSEPRRIEQSPEARRLERLLDPRRRQARSPFDQRLPDGRLHRNRRRHRTTWSRLFANSWRPAERGLVQ